jgi:hypothetical protein
MIEMSNGYISGPETHWFSQRWLWTRGMTSQIFEAFHHIL